MNLPVTIHRPAVVCGDSQTGETGKYDGVYYLIHYLLRWPRMLSLINIGNHEVSLNLVPVDFVVDAMAALACDERAIGKTLQLADPTPLTTESALQCDREIDRWSPVACYRARIVGLLLADVAAVAEDHRLAASCCSLLLREATYDTSQAQQLLEPHGIRCPPFESYVDKIVEFAEATPELLAALMKRINTDQ